MLSVNRCQRILNDASPPGVSYSRERAKKLRRLLYRFGDIFRDHADAPDSSLESTDRQSRHEESSPLQ